MDIVEFSKVFGPMPYMCTEYKCQEFMDVPPEVVNADWTELVHRAVLDGSYGDESRLNAAGKSALLCPVCGEIGHGYEDCPNFGKIMGVGPQGGI